MLRSLYSGISGLISHQTRMDVVGNNIANVNTVGYKASRVTFQDIYSQTIQPASSPSATTAGVDPQQVGLGVTIGSIDVLHTRGATEYTGSPLDLSIDGDGFFVVSDGSHDFYTRAGNFYLDANNNLVTSSGLFVKGWNNPVATNPTSTATQPATPTQPLDNIQIASGYNNVSISSMGEVIGVNTTTGDKEVIARLSLAEFNNQAALEKVGESIYAANNNTGAPTLVFPGDNSAASLNPSSLEMSNVDLAREFTEMIVTQRGFQANSRVITTSDQILEELVNLKR